MWDMVFWKKTQKQKVLMIFPYGLKTRIPLCLLLTMAEETNKAVFIFFTVMFYFEPIKRISVRTVLEKGLSSLPRVECNSINIFNLAEQADCLFQTLCLQISSIPFPTHKLSSNCVT